jgi:hypothetical protein
VRRAIAISGVGRKPTRQNRRDAAAALSCVPNSSRAHTLSMQPRLAQRLRDATRRAAATAASAARRAPPPQRRAQAQSPFLPGSSSTSPVPRNACARSAPITAAGTRGNVRRSTHLASCSSPSTHPSSWQMRAKTTLPRCRWLTPRLSRRTPSGEVHCWCHLRGVHGGRVRALGTAEHIRWELGPRSAPSLIVHGRERMGLPGLATPVACDGLALCDARVTSPRTA